MTHIVVLTGGTDDAHARAIAKALKEKSEAYSGTQDSVLVEEVPLDRFAEFRRSLTQGEPHIVIGTGRECIPALREISAFRMKTIRTVWSEQSLYTRRPPDSDIGSIAHFIALPESIANTIDENVRTELGDRLLFVPGSVKSSVEGGFDRAAMPAAEYIATRVHDQTCQLFPTHSHQANTCSLAVSPPETAQEKGL